MDLSGYFRRQFEYDAWANREVMSAVNRTEPQKRTLQLFSHILAAERLWLERIQQLPQSLPVWPDFDRERCNTETAKTATLWHNFLDQLSSDQLSRQVSYKNSKGDSFSGTVQDILTHVILHSAYHRGQIATQMRADGQDPAYTDFIHAARQGLIK